MFIGFHVKYPSLLPDFTKIRPVGAELLHADRRTGMTKLIVAFLQFFKRAKKKLRNCAMTYLSL